LKTSVHFAVTAVVLCFIAISFSGCADSIVFDRNLEIDPGSVNFLPEAVSDISVDIFKYSDDPWYINDILRIHWTDQSFFPAGYNIERRQGDDDFITLARLPSGSIEYLDTLSRAGIYTYRITAVSEHGLGHSVEHEYHLSPLGPGPEMNYRKGYSDQIARISPHEIAVYSGSTDFDYRSEILNLETLEWRVAEDEPDGYCRFFYFNDNRVVCSLQWSDEIKIYISGSWDVLRNTPGQQHESIVRISDDEILLHIRNTNVLPELQNRFYIFSYESNTLRQAPPPPEGRILQHSVILGNGTALIPASNWGTPNRNRALLYNPLSDVWSFTEEMINTYDYIKYATSLEDGSAIIIYQLWYDATPYHFYEIYQPESGSWILAETPFTFFNPVVKLENGNILAVGLTWDLYSQAIIGITEFDQKTRTWSQPLNVPHELLQSEPENEWLWRDPEWAIALPGNRALLISSESKKTFIYRTDGIPKE
jgi:hypothetical protein